MPNISNFTSIAHTHDIVPLKNVYSVSVAETVEVNDIVTRVQLIRRSLNETLSLDAVVARMLTASRTLNETLEIEDTVVRVKTFLRSLGETLQIDDVVARMLSAVRSLTDNITILADATRVSEGISTVMIDEAIAIQTQLSLFICWLGGRGPLPIITKRIGRFFSILPQRNIRTYSLKSKFNEFSENQQVER